ncbi:MAG: universal stress protein [Deltaproteobacteria bacterium]|nr:universal stress protein [Deltaproteobacteria bacterium]
MEHIERILVATDFSPCAERAVDVALALAKQWTSQVTLLHVIAPQLFGLGERANGREADAAYRQNAIDHATEQLAVEEGEASAAGLLTRAVVCEGHPAWEIARVARELPADLVVLGAQGRGGLSSQLLGSVAGGVIRNLEVPTLVVPLPREGRQGVDPTSGWSVPF